MTPPRFSFTAPRLLAGFGTLTLLAGLGLFASRPAHTAGGPIAVNVANTPLAVTLGGNAAGQPVEFQPVLSKAGPATTFYTVPAGKRLVIEYVNVVSNTPNDPNRYSFIVIHNTVFTNFSLVPDGSPFVAASQKVTLFADAGSQVSGFFQYSGGNASPNLYCTISGYLVDVP